MLTLIVRWVLMAIAVGATALFMPGMEIHQGLVGLLVVSAVLGLVNAIIRPIVMFLTCPLVILTLGLFAIVVNALMLWLTAWLLPNWLTIDGFWTTLAASMIISILSWFLNGLVYEKG
ncbi:MAG: phage holin family protein [Chloroflexi bacterium]|nr:phage holin family protein [Chloroflexota bacterium]